MLSAHNLACERGGRELFAGLSFAIAPGELLHIRGVNGSGKTTLLRALCGLSLPASGEIHWDGVAINACRETFHRQLLYLGHRHGLLADLSPIENLASYAALHAQSASPVATVLAEVGLAGHLHAPIKHLSQGQQRRAALARLSLQDAQLWILDEPFTALDTDAVDWLLGRIGEHLAQGGMAILTTHQESGITRHVSREIHLVSGVLL